MHKTTNKTWNNRSECYSIQILVFSFDYKYIFWWLSVSRSGSQLYCFSTFLLAHASQSVGLYDFCPSVSLLVGLASLSVGLYFYLSVSLLAGLASLSVGLYFYLSVSLLVGLASLSVGLWFWQVCPSFPIHSPNVNLSPLQLN